MVNRARYLLQNWKENINDFIVIKCEYISNTGREQSGYLVANLSTRISYNIEDNAIYKQLAEEMIAHGVLVLSEQESQKILFPHLFQEIQPDNKN